MPISEPSVTFNIIPASQLAGVGDQKTLIVGQMLAGGSATAGDLIQDIGNDGSEDSLFGQRSHLAGMIRAFKRENKVSQIDAISLADSGTATKGTSVVTFAGTATASGEINIIVGSGKDHNYEVSISTGQSATVVGDTLAALITADLDAPFTAVNAAGVVTITAANGGTLCNDWGLKTENTVAGITTTLTGWLNGATDPSLTGVLDAVANIRYQTVVWPSAYNLDTIASDLNAKFNVSNKILDGVAIQVKSDTLSNLKSYVSALNSQSVVVVGEKSVNLATRIGPSIMEMPDIVAAEMAAIRALRLTRDSNLTRYLTTTSSRDQFGGMAIGSLPYFNTALPNLPVASPVDEFSDEDLNELNSNGVSTFGPNRAFNTTIFGEVVTTYLTDTAGNPDISYRYLNTVDTASLIREFFFENFKKRYAQSRLTEGDLLPGRDMANESSIRAFCNELYDALADEVLVQKGTAAKKDFNDNLAIVLTMSQGKVQITMAPLLVTQLRIVIGTIQINFGSN